MARGGWKGRHAVLMLLLAILVAAPAAMAAEALVLLTEENPPYNFTDPATGRVAGITGELMALVMARTGIAHRTEIVSWEEGYRRARAEPGTCVYSATMSGERLPLFRWVTPLGDAHFAVFGTGRRKDISSLEELRGLRIGVQSNGPFERILRDRGFEVAPMDKEQLFHALADGKVDAVAYGLRNGRWQARTARVPVRVIMKMLAPTLGMACHPATDPELLAKLNAALGDLHADGTAGRILARYE